MPLPSLIPGQSLAKLREKFNVDQTTETSEPDLSSSSVNSQLCFPRQTLDTGSQTDISGEVSFFPFCAMQREMEEECCCYWNWNQMADCCCR